jgi:hypothetical protein
LFGVILERDPDEIQSAYDAIASAQESELLLAKITKTLREKSMLECLQRIEDVLQTKLVPSYTNVSSVSLEQAFHNGLPPPPPSAAVRADSGDASDASRIQEDKKNDEPVRYAGQETSEDEARETHTDDAGPK